MINYNNLFEWMRLVLIILIVVATGMFILNQGAEFFYKSQLAMQPCALCAKLNPEVESCLITKRAIFPGANGWQYENGSTYNSEDKIIYNITLDYNVIN